MVAIAKTKVQMDEAISFPMLLDPAEHNRIMFLGVPLEKGIGGPRAPALSRFTNYIETEFDRSLARDLAIAVSLNQPVLVEGGSGLGKTEAIDRICAITNKEVYYANCHDMPPDLLIGRLTATEDSKSGFGWKDGIVLQAIRNGGVLVLDEYNFMHGETRARLHEVLDAILRGKKEVVLLENNGEVVPVHPEFRLVALENPPGDEFTDREVLDPAQISRFVYLKLPSDMSKDIRLARVRGFCNPEEIESAKEPEALPFQAPLPIGFIRKIPGFSQILEKYVEFSVGIEKLVRERKAGQDQVQPLHFAFQRDLNRILTFVSHYYTGDLNATFQKALEYYFVNRFETDGDRAKVRELTRLVQHVSPVGTATRIAIDEKDELVPAPTIAPTSSFDVSPEVARLKTLMGKNYIGPEDYKEIFGVTLIGGTAPLPGGLTEELLNSECPLFNAEEKVPLLKRLIGKGSEKPKLLIKDTHILAYIPSVLGEVDLTINAFQRIANELTDSEGKEPCIRKTNWHHGEDFANAGSTGHWVLIPRDILPGSTNKNGEEQDKYLGEKFPQYETAKALDLTVAIGMNYLKNGERRYTDWGTCGEFSSAGFRVCVGRFHADGLRVSDWDGGRLSSFGRAVVRRFGK